MRSRPRSYGIGAIAILIGATLLSPEMEDWQIVSEGRYRLTQVLSEWSPRRLEPPYTNLPQHRDRFADRAAGLRRGALVVAVSVFGREALRICPPPPQ